MDTKAEILADWEMTEETFNAAVSVAMSQWQRPTKTDGAVHPTVSRETMEEFLLTSGYETIEQYL